MLVLVLSSRRRICNLNCSRLSFLALLCLLCARSCSEVDGGDRRGRLASLPVCSKALPPEVGRRCC